MKIEWKTCFRVGLSAFLLFLAIYYWKGLTGGLSLLVGAASPLILGAVIAYLINIPMSFYERFYFPRSTRPLVIKTRRAVCMCAAILTVLGIIALVIGLVIPELVASIELLISWIPDAVEKAVKFVLDSESVAEIIPQEYLDKLSKINWEEWFSTIVQFLSTGIGGAVGTAVGAITSVFSAVVSLLCGVIFAIYLLTGKERLQAQCHRLMKNYLPDVWRERICYVLTVLNDCFHRYVVGQCTEAVILGCLCIIGMWIFRLPYATMVGTLVGFTALIPVAGAYIGAAVGAFMILMVSPIKALLFVIFLSVLQQLEGNLIYPKVVGSSMGLPGMWVLAAVTVGGGLFGITGMLVGVPLVAALYKLLRDDVHKREGKERVALSRKRRERQERRRLKDRAEAQKQQERTQVNGESGLSAQKRNETKQERTQRQKNTAKENGSPKQGSGVKETGSPKQKNAVKETGSPKRGNAAKGAGSPRQGNAAKEAGSPGQGGAAKEAGSPTQGAGAGGDNRPGNNRSRRRKKRSRSDVIDPQQDVDV